jgi:hypothetical protein
MLTWVIYFSSLTILKSIFLVQYSSIILCRSKFDIPCSIFVIRSLSLKFGILRFIFGRSLSLESITGLERCQESSHYYNRNETDGSYVSKEKTGVFNPGFLFLLQKQFGVAKGVTEACLTPACRQAG